MKVRDKLKGIKANLVTQDKKLDKVYTYLADNFHMLHDCMPYYTAKDNVQDVRLVNKHLINDIDKLIAYCDRQDI